jgi:hypothetical protein
MLLMSVSVFTHNFSIKGSIYVKSDKKIMTLEDSPLYRFSDKWTYVV